MAVSLPVIGHPQRFTFQSQGIDSRALAELACGLKASHKPLVILTANAFEAQRLLEEIPFFAKDITVNVLPDWETLPYDVFSPHPDLISERLAKI